MPAFITQSEERADECRLSSIRCHEGEEKIFRGRGFVEFYALLEIAAKIRLHQPLPKQLGLFSSNLDPQQHNYVSRRRSSLLLHYS